MRKLLVFMFLSLFISGCSVLPSSNEAVMLRGDYVFKHDDSLYGVLSSDELFSICRKTNDNFEVLLRTENGLSNIIVYDRKIFFIDIYGAERNVLGQIYSCNTDGSDLKQVTTDYTEGFIIYDKRIIYQAYKSSDPKYKNSDGKSVVDCEIKSISLDGNSVNILFSQTISNVRGLFTIHNDIIYLPEEKLHSINLKTNEIDYVQLIHPNFDFYTVDVFFIENIPFLCGPNQNGDDYALYKCDFDFGKMTQIVDAVNYCHDNSSIYYESGNNTITRYNITSGQSVELISDDEIALSDKIVVVDNNLYCYWLNTEKYDMRTFIIDK